jgi:regulator of sigma E protease
MLDFLLGNDALSTIVAFLLVLIPAVFIHELGHFLAAKAVGITILEFGIGMPPRMFKLFTLRGTDYTLNWLPLGGFVRPLGEDLVRPIGEEATQQDKSEAQARGIVNPKSVNETKPLPRMFFMAGGALANFLTAFLLFIIIALIGLPQVTGSTVNLLYVPPTSALGEAGLQYGDMIEEVNGTQFANLDEFFALLRAAEDTEVTLTIDRLDQDENVTITFAPNLPEGAADIDTNPLVAGIAAGSPADRAGLQANDLIVAFNGEPLADYEALQRMTRANLGEQVTLTVWRNGETFETTLTPRANPPEGQGAMGIQVSNAATDSLLGLVFQEGFQQALVAQPVGVAVDYSFERIGQVFSAIVSVPGQIINGSASSEEMRLTSPLGISQVGGVFLQESIERDQPGIILEYVALISLALGFTNLLPIPALDGGRILFVLIEIVRGRPIAPEREGMVHLVGMALLLSLMVVVLLNDITNPLTNLLR